MCKNLERLFNDIMIDEEYKEVPPKAGFIGGCTVV